ncbi:MAG: hypothetical protein ACLQVI_05370 [Polyangiaceae bacterium]|jgi:hypothetical protein
MKSKRILTSTFWLACGAVLLTIPAASSSIEACGESGACSQLRTNTFADLQTWSACDPSLPDSQCIFVAGNPKDCTGILSCEFAVNVKYRETAELAVATIGEQSQGCYLCAIPDCISPGLAICEPVSRECIAVTAVEDAGTVTVPVPVVPVDSGVTPLEQ